MERRKKEDFVYGTRAVLEAIKAGKEVDKLWLQKDVKNELVGELITTARSYGIPFVKVPSEKLNRITKKNHQGVIASLSAVQYASLDHLFQRRIKREKILC